MTNKQTVIDSHWHVYPFWDAAGTDIHSVMERYRKENGMQAFNLCSVPIHGERGPVQNILAAVCKLHNPKAYAYGGIVYPQRPFEKPMPQGMDPLSQYRELMELGFDGIKMLETKPFEQKEYGIRIDDPYFEEFFAACEENATHMIWHVADPGTFWDLKKIPKRFLDRGWYYGDGTYMSYEQMYAQVYHVLDKHPALRVTFAHFFFLSGQRQKLEALFAKYPGAAIDITPGSEMYADFRADREGYRDFFIRYADRIFYGTDTSFTGLDMERFAQRAQAVKNFLTTDGEVTVISETCRGLALPKEAADKILYQNFLSVAGAAPKPVNRDALRAYVEKYRYLITDGRVLSHIDSVLA